MRCMTRVSQFSILLAVVVSSDEYLAAISASFEGGWTGLDFYFLRSCLYTSAFGGLRCFDAPLTGRIPMRTG